MESNSGFMNINPKKEKASKDKGNADIDKVVEYFFYFWTTPYMRHTMQFHLPSW